MQGAVSASNARRLFVKELPNAIDSIVRGTRAGLHVNECVRQNKPAAEIQKNLQSVIRATFTM